MSKQVRPPAEMDSDVFRHRALPCSHPSWIAGVTLPACCLVLALCGCGTTSPGAASSQTKPAQHQVDLSWDAPGASPVAIVGYNVYRAPQGNASYQRLNSSTDTETVYLDSLVTSGASYSYFVTSVDTYGGESAPSNSVDVTIP